MKKIFFTLFFLVPLFCFSQLGISVGADLSGLRNFSPRQKFWALGQTTEFNYHFSEKESLYAWLNYYANGSFKNNFSGVAKSPTTTPSSITYRVTGRWQTREASIGWKHYLRGSCVAERGRWNVFGTAGFGLMFVAVENSFAPPIDTSLYIPPLVPTAGAGGFKRLTLDLGMGAEYSLGGDLYIYSNLRTWIPTTNYPSIYLHNNADVPLPIIANLGLRILFASY